MEEIDKCTKISDFNERQSYFRRMYNASQEQVLAQFRAICMEAEMAPITQNLETMETADVNNFVIRMYDPRQNAAAAQLRKSTAPGAKISPHATGFGDALPDKCNVIGMIHTGILSLITGGNGWGSQDRTHTP